MGNFMMMKQMKNRSETDKIDRTAPDTYVAVNWLFRFSIDRIHSGTNAFHDANLDKCAVMNFSKILHSKYARIHDSSESIHTPFQPSPILNGFCLINLAT